jgi:hypothetical protein
VHKRAIIRISKSDAGKNKQFYRWDDKPCDNTFIDGWKPIYVIELTTKLKESANDIDWLIDKVKKIKNELRRVCIKNHNMKASFASVKSLLVTNLVCVNVLNYDIVYHDQMKWITLVNSYLSCTKDNVKSNV